MPRMPGTPELFDEIEQENHDPFQVMKRWANDLKVPIIEEHFSEMNPRVSNPSRSPYGLRLEGAKRKTIELERQDFDIARKRLHPAEELRLKGLLLESILYCGPILRQEMEQWLPSAHQSKSPLMRQCLLQLLWVLCEQYPDIPRVLVRPSHGWRRLGYTEFLGQVVKQIIDTSNIALLHVARDISGYTLVNPASGQLRQAQWSSKRIFDRMHSFLGLEDRETLLALKYLAESSVCHGYYGNMALDDMDYSCNPIIPWSQQKVWALRHGLQLKKDLGPDHPDSLRYHYAMARATLAKGNPATVKDMLREVFDRREKAFGEVHSKSLNFIDNILDDYCEERTGAALDYSRLEVWDSSLIDDLIEFCLEQEAYEEVDVLAQECNFQRKVTNTHSPNEAFSGWYQFEMKGGCRVQARLASIKTPAEDWYWEDSRMYFRAWDQVTLIAGYPEDPCPKTPAKIIVLEESIEAEIPLSCLEDSQACYEDIYKNLRDCEVWRLLEAKRLSGDWKILLACDSQNWDTKCKALAAGSPNHEFYVSLDSLVIPNALEPAVSPLENLN
jgi:hypothetical protein